MQDQKGPGNAGLANVCGSAMIRRNATLRLDISRFAELFGTTEDQISAQCRSVIEKSDFSYRVIEGSARDHIILEELKTIEGDLPISGRARRPVWEDGWSDNLRAFVASGYDLNQLVPRYYGKPGQLLRLSGEYVRPSNPDFELNLLGVMMIWLAGAYMRGVHHVYEFGCGSGYNLAALASVYPCKSYYGLDWTKSSTQIIEALAESHGFKMTGGRFDMLEPDENIKIDPNSAVLTVCALEQSGRDFGRFLDYLLAASPRVCVHIEPIHELYDPESLFDYVAAEYAKKRDYLRGFLPRLTELQAAGRIQIRHVKKVMGDRHNDTWTVVVWEPIKPAAVRRCR